MRPVAVPRSIRVIATTATKNGLRDTHGSHADLRSPKSICCHQCANGLGSGQRTGSATANGPSVAGSLKSC